MSARNISGGTGLSVTSPSASESVEMASTPLMRQYAAAKQKYPGTLLFFRLGDFYELFYEDARTASRELQITLTCRDKERAIPMCGVPHHAADQYIARLLRLGYRIAICEQLEDPKLTKTIVRREVTRVLTPGTAIDPTLHSERNNFLAALCFDGSTIGLALLDNSTGDFRATEFRGRDAQDAAARCGDELARYNPAEILFAENVDGAAAQLEDALRSRTVTHLEPWVLTRDYAMPLLENHLGARDLAGFGLEGHTAAAVAAGGILHYLRATQLGQLEHIDRVRYYEHSGCLQLDAVTVRNLELVEPLMPDARRHTTLFHTLDLCQTPMGKRKLRSTILRPLLDLATIDERLDGVAELHRDLQARERVRESIGGILDLERLLSRISLDSAGPRDLLALAISATKLPAVAAELAQLQSAAWKRMEASLDCLADLQKAISTTLTEQPPVHLEDGGAIAGGVDAELDRLRSLSLSGKQSIAAIEERERQRTGIGSLKVRYNSVFGYYIEVTKSNLDNVPAEYERKQTLVNAERFTTQELKEYERSVLGAQERCLEIERRIFLELRQTALAASARIRATAEAIAEVDLLACFAHLAAARQYVRPQVDDSGIFEALAARHPVIEWHMEQASEGRFVPNSIYLDTAGPSLLLLTGPNMGGKSTYLRQTALLAILAQMGCFVPAQRMRLGIVDRIYTRIGASDNVAEGRSTFMVEMTETATILNTATSRSLLLLDEMGRGTATFDGMSLAWATVEYIHEVLSARTLFATHYHELTMLAGILPRLKNLRVTVQENPKGIVFLHAIEEGAANKSYGIEVARLAGIPRAVVVRAREILRQHERSEKREIESSHDPDVQMTLFTPLSQRIVDQIHALDLNSLTPMQALNLLQELQQEVREGSTPVGTRA
ncbi:MAG: DNA mismatch repair protein MutS [Acidobacteriaceae bacterium]